MTVRKFLSLWVDDISVQVYQLLPSNELRRYRQTGSVDVLINSNADYLDFNIVNLQMDDGMILIVCKEREEHVDWNTKTIDGDITVEMLRDCFSQNNWDHIILHFADGVNIGVTAYSSGPDNVRCESAIEYYEVSLCDTWQGANTLAQVADICNQHKEIVRKYDEDKKRLYQYFLEHIADEEFGQDEWDYYSDWHKDVFGHRPNGVTFG